MRDNQEKVPPYHLISLQLVIFSGNLEVSSNHDSVNQPVTQKSPTAKSPEAPVTQQNPEKSLKSSRNAMDSIKIMRGKMKKAKSPNKGDTAVAKKEDDDSQHTEIINVPLGKAAETVPNVSRMTPSKMSKTRERVRSPGAASPQRVTFAEKLTTKKKETDKFDEKTTQDDKSNITK